MRIGVIQLARMIFLASTNDVQKAKPLGLKKFHSRLDTTDPLKRLRIWQMEAVKNEVGKI